MPALYVILFMLYITLCTTGSDVKNERFKNRIRNKRSVGDLCGLEPRMCCPGRNSDCKRGKCYCDEYCMEKNDCCSDYISTCQFGPCNNYTVIKNEEKRSSDYRMDASTDVPLSDEMLQRGWYRVLSVNGGEMPTNPPGVFYCGTENPIWMNGTFPTVSDSNFTTEACLQTVNGTCELLLEIQIVNCSEGFYVYLLQNTTRNSAFCFGSGPVRCYGGLSSESGYYPGCSSLYPNETIVPAVQALLIDGKQIVPGKRPSQSPAFLCIFDDVSNGSYVYDVTWYINGDNVTVFKNIPFDNINTTALTAAHWVNKYWMNMKVACSVRSRYSNDSVPSQSHYSENYAAGLFPEQYEYTVIEGESINVTFSSSVPVACLSADHQSFCYQSFNIFQPQFAGNEVECSKNFVNRDVVFKSCGFKLGSSDWKAKKTLEIYGFIDGSYNHLDRSTYIWLSSKLSVGNEIWANLTIPGIKVTVMDKDSVLTSRVCQCYNDPHLTTFDGKTYHYMDVGEYVLYRNIRGPYWVHALFTSCGFGWAGSSCNCGIAIRSKTSLFVLRTCSKISRNNKFLLDQPHTEIRRCFGSDFTIAHTRNNYKVVLPIGTEIRFTVSPDSKFITRISIKPSLYDLNKAEGLCGVPSSPKNISDDFTQRDLGSTDDEKRFADSWRINSTMAAEKLFVREPEFLSHNGIYQPENTNATNTNLTHYCTCERQAGSGDILDNFYTLQCNLTETTEQCSIPSQPVVVDGNTVPAFVTSCSTTYRQKRSPHRIFRRSVFDSDDVVEFPTLEYEENVLTTDVAVPHFRDGWTEEKANQTCNVEINKDVPVDLLGSLTELVYDDYIAACILDIKATAGTEFLKDTVGAMQTFTLIEVSRNETLSIQKTEDGSQSILDYVTSLLCPNNCNGNGNCTSGICSCHSGYVGEDCSTDILIPPNNISLPSDGICLTNTRSCKRTNIFGTFQSTNIWSKQRYFQIINDTMVNLSDPQVTKADYRNVFMVSVNLQSQSTFTDSFTAVGYEISLSNDGTHFGETVNLIIHDEDCLDCTSTTTSITCVELDSCPALQTSRTVLTTEPTETTSGQFTTTSKQTHTTTFYQTTTDIETSSETTSTTPATSIFETSTMSNIITSNDTSDSSDTTTTIADETTITETKTMSDLPTLLETSTMAEETNITETKTMSDLTTVLETSTMAEETTSSETKTMSDQTTLLETSTTSEETTITETKTVSDQTTFLETSTTAEETTITETKTMLDQTTFWEISTMAEETTSSETKTMSDQTTLLETSTTAEETTISETKTVSDLTTLLETSTMAAETTSKLTTVTSSKLDTTTVVEEETLPTTASSLPATTTGKFTTLTYTTRLHTLTSPGEDKTSVMTNIISTKATMTERETTAELTTTPKVSTTSEITTLETTISTSKETEGTTNVISNHPSGAERFASYTVPMVIGVSVGVFSVVVLGVFICRTIRKSKKRNGRSYDMSMKQFEEWSSKKESRKAL